MEMMQLTPADDGRTVEVRAGDDVVLALPENPSTGYRWHAELDPNLAVTSSEWVTGGQGAGAGGVRRMRIHAVHPGEGHVRLKHWREWLGDASVTMRHAFTLRVR